MGVSMDCARVLEVSYLVEDRQLEPRTIRAFEEHLAVCPECAERAVVSSRVVRVIRDRLTRARAPDRLRRALRCGEEGDDAPIAVGQR